MLAETTNKRNESLKYLINFLLSSLLFMPSSTLMATIALNTSIKAIIGNKIQFQINWFANQYEPDAVNEFNVFAITNK